MRKLVIILAALLLSGTAVRAQVDLEKEFFSLPDSVTNAYLDSIDVQIAPPNDYWMVGVFGGASMQYGFFNPERLVKPVWSMPVYGFSVVRHFTMFGIFHNMGLEFGAQQNYEGYEFKTNKETGYRSVESGAYRTVMKVPEVFLNSHFHVDMNEYFKIVAKLGIYGGYRQSIQRTLDQGYDENPAYQALQNEFRDYDRRYTYGIQGGLGIAVMFSPFEFHLNAQAKWGWNSFWNPDYYSKYSYRFAYPLDATFTFGVYYQFTPRYGHTRGQLRKLARKMVQEQNETHE